MKVITRKEAKEKGLKKYFTGVVCVNGHISERRVCNSECIECEKERKSKKRGNSVVKTELKVVGKKVRIVKFKFLNRVGRNKFNKVILEDKIVNVG